MSITWLEIGTDRIIAFHNHAEGVIGTTNLPAIHYSALLSLGNLVKPSQVGGGSNAPNLTATIENGDGRFTNLAAEFIGETATVKRLTGTLFTGVVESIDIGEVIGLRVVG